jgi:hypothetical protein
LSFFSCFFWFGLAPSLQILPSKQINFHAIPDKKTIAINQEAFLHFRAGAFRYFMPERGLELSPQTKTTGLVRFAIRNTSPVVTVPA